MESCGAFYCRIFFKASTAVFTALAQDSTDLNLFCCLVGYVWPPQDEGSNQLRHLVNVNKKLWKDPPFFMGKFTISTGQFSSSQTVSLLEGNQYSILNQCLRNSAGNCAKQRFQQWIDLVFFGSVLQKQGMTCSPLHCQSCIIISVSYNYRLIISHLSCI